jgi:anti-sigma regulatory factor (Ser/Thr protein kinase)
MGSHADADHAPRPKGKGKDGPGRLGSGPVVAPASALRWWQVFRGEASEVGAVRRWLASLLPECPARDDVISVATELASNAIMHTASGHHGMFAVEVTWHRAMVRVAVADRGAPAEPRVVEDPDGEAGRGLLLVRGLSVRTGVEGDHQGRTLWAEVSWEGPDADVVGAAEAAIREGEQALARCFPGVLAWFGRSTREWWALTGTDRLVGAPTAARLADWLYRVPDAPSPTGTTGFHRPGRPRSPIAGG